MAKPPEPHPSLEPVVIPNGDRYVWRVRRVKARNFPGDLYLADGGSVDNMSYQLNWIYGDVFNARGELRVVRRRWRYDQWVWIAELVRDGGSDR